jgi:hypothetical protein
VAEHNVVITNSVTASSEETGLHCMRGTAIPVPENKTLHEAVEAYKMVSTSYICKKKNHNPVHTNFFDHILI